MKKLLPILIILSCALLKSHAQTKEHYLNHTATDDPQLFEEKAEAAPNEDYLKNETKTYLKNTNAVAQVLSSEQYSYSSLVDSTLTTKYFYTYDGNGNKLKDTKQLFDNSSGQWYDSEIIDYTYNEFNLLTMKITQYRSTPSNPLAYYSKQELAYDVNGNTTLDIRFNYDGNNWNGYKKYEHSYNTDNKQLNYSRYKWESNDWICDYQNQYAYDQWGNHILTYWLRWNYDLNILSPSYKNEYEYNAEGHQLHRTEYRYWNTSINDWDSKSKYSFQHNSLGEWIHCDKYEMPGNTWVKVREGHPHRSKAGNAYYDWINFTDGQLSTPFSNFVHLKSSGATNISLFNRYDETTNTWQQVDRDEYAYNSNGQRLLHCDYNWDELTNNWKGSRKYEYAYDNLGKRTLYVRSDWDDLTNSFYTYRKEEWLFDASGNELLYVRYYYNPDNMILEGQSKRTKVFNQDHTLFYETSYNWNSNTADWETVPDSKIFYTYNNQPTSNLELLNDASGFIYSCKNDLLTVKSLRSIENNYTIELFSMGGEKVLTKNAQSDKLEISTSHLNPGTYIIINSSDKENPTKVIIK